MNLKRILFICFIVLPISVVLTFAQTKNSLIINVDQGKHKINKNIYGHFSEHLGGCIYGGIWVGEDSSIPNTRGIRNDVVSALRKMKIPVLRWPGGCFADEYHWKDGIGPREGRPTMINTHWGGVTENNNFGTHEFLDLCQQLSCEPYICGNVGSGTVEELAEWVEYVTFDGKSPMADWRRKNGRENPWKVKFWGVGNENWGCGGNMRPEYYADVYQRFRTYVRSYSGNRPYRIACGAYDENYEWTEVLMKNVGRRGMQGLSFHYYTVFENWENKGSATQFDEHRWFGTLKTTLKMEELIKKHTTIMDKYDPEKRVAFIIDEWGDWFDVEPGANPGFLYQQNTLRDALVAGINLNIFNTYCERVKMANIAQTINVLQSMILTKEEKMILTPTYHVFEMYNVHQDATLLPSVLECTDYKYKEETVPSLSASASKDSTGNIHVSICNLNPNEDAELDCEIRGSEFNELSARILTADKINAHNTFENPAILEPKQFKDLKKNGNHIIVNVPAKSVVVIKVK
jgi:alpha-N-arabinofuranosidase